MKTESKGIYKALLFTARLLVKVTLMWKSIGVGPSTPFARLEKLIFLVFLGWSHIYYIYIYIHISSHIALRLWKLDRVSRFNSVRSYRLDRTIRSFGSTRFDSAPSVESDREIAFPIEVCIYDLTIRAANLLPTSIGVFLQLFARIGVDDRILGCSNVLRTRIRARLSIDRLVFYSHTNASFSDRMDAWIF